MKSRDTIVFETESIIRFIKQHFFKLAIFFFLSTAASFSYLQQKAINSYISTEEISIKTNYLSTEFGEIKNSQISSSSILEIIQSPHISDRTFEMLNLDSSWSKNRLKEGISFTNLNCEDQLCATISFISFQPNSNVILSKYIDNYLVYFNNSLMMDVYKRIKSSKKTEILYFEKESKSLEYKISLLRETLDSIKQTNINLDLLSKVGNKYISSNIHDITNSNYENIEAKIVELKQLLIEAKAKILFNSRNIQEIEKKIKLINKDKFTEEVTNAINDKATRLIIKENIRPGVFKAVVKSVIFGIGATLIIFLVIVIFTSLKKR